MVVPCDNCDFVEMCADIGRCFRKGLDVENEGEVIDDGDDDINDDGHIRKVRLEEPKQLDDQHRQFLNDVIFL